MYEIVFADADPDAVVLYNASDRLQSSAMAPLEPPVDWDANDVSYGDGVEVSILFFEEPEDREVECLMLALEATALTVRQGPGWGS